MPERKCDFKLVAFVNGKRTEIECKPEYGCLRDYAWSGIGLKTAAAIALGLRSTDNVDACAEGDCRDETSSDVPQE